MARPTTLPQLMEDLKRRKKMRRRNSRLHLVYIFLFLTVLGISATFLLVATPFFSYFIPIEKAGDSTSAPQYSLNTIMKSGGITGNESDFTITGAELRRDSTRSWVVGTVTNTGSKSYQSLTIFYDLFDKDGNTLGSTYVMMGSLDPGESVTFSTIPYTGKAAAARKSYILGN